MSRRFVDQLLPAPRRLPAQADWAIREAGDQMLQDLSTRPLLPTFHGRPGITRRVRTDLRSPRNQDSELCALHRQYQYAQALQARALIEITVQGATVFDVTLTEAGAAYLHGPPAPIRRKAGCHTYGDPSPAP